MIKSKVHNSVVFLPSHLGSPSDTLSPSWASPPDDPFTDSVTATAAVGKLGDCILRIADVCALTCVSRATIYAWVRQRLFPRPRKLGPRASGWLSTEVLVWLRSRP
jgi:prophage regulatory protein